MVKIERGAFLRLPRYGDEKACFSRNARLKAVKKSVSMYLTEKLYSAIIKAREKLLNGRAMYDVKNQG